MASTGVKTSSKTTKATKSKLSWGEVYLANYNAISAFLWFNIPLRLLQIYTKIGPDRIFDGTSGYLKYVQALALLELIHSATGLVRAPLSTTALQVASRIFVVWTVAEMFPESVRICPGYPVMLLAWSITEVIRYTFYAWNLVDEVPYPLLWLRYTTFWVLYPIGVGGEVWTTVSALKQAYDFHPLYAAYMVGILLIYIPGFYTLYTHMIKQRRKVLGKKSPKEGVTQKNK